MSYAVSQNEHGEHHVLPLSTLAKVFGALVVLTIITVAVARQDLGPMNVVVALIIACIKATIVAAWFMHLKYGKKLNVIIFAISLFLVAVMIIFIITDAYFYYHNINEFRLDNPPPPVPGALAH